MRDNDNNNTNCLRQLDSISHISFDEKNKILYGSGLSRGSSESVTVTESGDKIKAGRYPVLFFADKKLQVQLNQKHRINRAGYDLARLQRRVTALHSQLCNDKSRSTQGPNNSV